MRIAVEGIVGCQLVDRGRRRVNPQGNIVHIQGRAFIVYGVSIVIDTKLNRYRSASVLRQIDLSILPAREILIEFEQLLQDLAAFQYVSKLAAAVGITGYTLTTRPIPEGEPCMPNAIQWTN